MDKSKLSSLSRMNMSYAIVCVLVVLSQVVSVPIQGEGLHNSDDKTENKPQKVLQLVRFNHLNCNKQESQVIIKDLSVENYVSSGKSQLRINSSVEVLRDLVDPLQLNVLMYLHVGELWLQVPCVNNLGSCHYDDVCALAASFPCPDTFTNHNISCQCPFKKNNYTVSNAVVDIPDNLSPQEIITTSTLIHGNDTVLCQQIYAKLDYVELEEINQ